MASGRSTLLARCRRHVAAARLRRGDERSSALVGARDEAGAVLVLALVFLVAVSLIVTALLTWVGGSLVASGAFANERSIEISATSAVNLAIQNTRYTFSSAMVNASPPVNCWDTSGTSSYTNPDPSNGITVDVWCSMLWQPKSVHTRTITYSACAITSANPSPTAASCAQAPLLQAQVTFDDLPSGAPPAYSVQCSGPGNNGTCGLSLTQNSWLWHPVVPSVTSLSATSGPISGQVGGTPVTITVNGNGLVPGTTVSFVEETGANPIPGSVPSTPNVPATPSGSPEGVIVPATVVTNSGCSGPNNTNCSVTVDLPAVTSGPYYFVTVTTPSGTSAYQNAGNYIEFTYTVAAPTVSAIGISGGSGGPITGGTLINVTGTNFYSVPNFATAVTLCTALPCTTGGSGANGYAATSVHVTSSTSLTAISPSVPNPSSGSLTYFVQVSTIGGSSTTTSDTYVYGLQVPIIFSLTPTQGPAGTVVTISGYNFMPNSQVGWVQVSANDQSATPTNVGPATYNPASGSAPATLTVTVPSLPTVNTYYIPVIEDPSPYTPANGYPYSQPYNQPADEFYFT